MVDSNIPVNTVGLVVGIILIEGQEDQGVAHEVLVLQERRHPAAFPLGTKGDVGVVSIVSHVGGNEGPLRKLFVGQISLEIREVLDLASTGLVLDNGVVENQRVVLAHIVVGASLLVGVIEALEAGEGHVLLVLAPRDALGIEQISDGGDVGRNLVEVVVVHAKGVTTSSSAVVRLRRVGHSVEVGPENLKFSMALHCGGRDVDHLQQDTLAGQPLHVGVRGSILIVNVLQPDLVEPVESQTLNIRGGGLRESGGSSLVDIGHRGLRGGCDLGVSQGGRSQESGNDSFHCSDR